MRKILRDIVRYLRRQDALLSAVERAIVIIAITVMVLRIIFPVWHLWDGYVLYAYPFRESATCLERQADCQVDRSRTAIEAAGIGLIVLGVLIVRRRKK